MITTNWHGLYRDSWKLEIYPESFAHPAKFTPGLIRRIYDHAAEEGWLKPGDVVLDPFGGVALGALHALRHGLSWIGIELESRFVEMGEKNIALWNRRYASLNGWGTARIIQGDSRRLCEVLREIAVGVISSPPYADTPTIASGVHRNEANWGTGKSLSAGKSMGYGETPGNLGNMPSGGFDAAVTISSPPFGGSELSTDKDFAEKVARDKRGGSHLDLSIGCYESIGNLAQMPNTGFEAVVSSPPFLDQEPSHAQKDSPSKRRLIEGDGACRRCTMINSEYGNSDGQLGKMRPGGIDSTISSPPYEATHVADTEASRLASAGLARMIPDGAKDGGVRYRGGDMGQGETFWSAARQIVEQSYLLLRPGGHAIWVVKAFVKNKAIVDFPGQWQALCESVGFRTLHVHRAWVVEDYGTQMAFDGNHKPIQREYKSFFRRLSEKKGSPRIDFENVICTKKL